MTTLLQVGKIAVMDKHPYVLAIWDWSTGHLQLRMIAQTMYGTMLPMDEATTHVHHTYRWASRQAARQFLNRAKERMQRGFTFGEAWQVLDLRQVEAPWR